MTVDASDQDNDVVFDRETKIADHQFRFRCIVKGRSVVAFRIDVDTLLDMEGTEDSSDDNVTRIFWKNFETRIKPVAIQKIRDGLHERSNPIFIWSSEVGLSRPTPGPGVFG